MMFQTVLYCIICSAFLSAMITRVIVLIHKLFIEPEVHNRVLKKARQEGRVIHAVLDRIRTDERFDGYLLTFKYTWEGKEYKYISLFEEIEQTVELYFRKYPRCAAEWFDVGGIELDWIPVYAATIVLVMIAYYIKYFV